ncbi:MAG: efflux RND transporter periplasmic adaptor subunit [Desulfobacteraceae bacterium]|nr:efflux RND transporter periplasmic adaptor subunit [Desulfobacteraceae bacterium]
MSGEERKPSEKKRRWSPVFVLIALVAVGVAFLGSILLRSAKRESLRKETRQRQETVQAGPSVRYVEAKSASPYRTLELVGEARPYVQATLYAKVSGYLAKINVDHGDRVREGQVLAVVEAPELDRQYQAALEDARNKEAQAKRGWALFSQKAGSLEDAQNREATSQVSRATAASLLTQKEYQIIRSPINGIVTARFADPGALVQNAQTTQTSALPIVMVSQCDKLKVYTYSDQKTAGFIKVNDSAEIWDVTRADVRVPAKVSRTSVQLDQKTRTLLIELDVDNEKSTLVPGGFVKVALTVQTPPRVEVPAEALVFRSGDPFVAVITDENTVNFRSVAIAFSDGKQVRLTSGVKEGEKVATNLGAGIAEGERVRPVKPSNPAEKAGNVPTGPPRKDQRP